MRVVFAHDHDTPPVKRTSLPVEELRAKIAKRRQRRADDARVIRQAADKTKTPWQPPPKPSALRWRRGRGPGSYA